VAVPRLAERRNQIARTMSGGEQQMVAIGRALMSNPTILMLDEPSLGLSPLLTKDLFKSLKAVKETGVGILLVEQNAKQSLAIADRGYLIENGHITGEGTGAELARDPAVQAAYLGGVSADIPKHSPEIKPHMRMPMAAFEADDGSALALAQRAARIQRDHVEAVRSGHLNGLANGHGHHIAEKLASNRDAIVMSGQAHELSLKAAEFAKRAAQIQRDHVDAQRLEHHVSAVRQAAGTGGMQPARPASSDETHALSQRAEEFAKKAAAIHANFVSASRETTALRPRSAEIPKPKYKTKKQRKLAKKAEKLARKAEKLAQKALRASG
jgi:branched-chain amino acid transport system ATP-binding protein